MAITPEPETAEPDLSEPQPPRGAAQRRLVLASGSPRRRELLRGLGLEPEIRPVDLDETPLAGEDPSGYVERLARAKAAARCDELELVIAADTTVALGDRILGKPETRAESAAMLDQLAGREHDVLTGLAVALRPGNDSVVQVVSEVVATRVSIARLSAAMRDWYVATGEGDDKAGAYGIQGHGALFVESIAGNYTNVVGLPLPQLEALLGRLGWSLLDWLPVGVARVPQA